MSVVLSVSIKSILPSAVMMSVAIQLIMLSVGMICVFYAEYFNKEHYAKFCYPECHLR